LGFIAFYGMILLSALTLAKDGVLQRVDGYPLQLALASSFVVLITTRLVLSQVDNDQIVFMFFGLAFALLYRSKRASAEQVG
jgi:4-amino-4-deoxy-L-arabinose transferase-like glycosyltransferase